MIDRNQPTYLIAVDGGLRTVPAYMVNDLLKQGWRKVDFPKRTYYPEFDKTSPHYKPQEDSTKEIETLQVEVL